MLKDTWVDKKDGVDINSAEDINQVAHAVIDLEKEAENKDETGIHIGPEAPTNGEQIWIDTDEENAEAGGTSIDVTAEVGQTIIVKEVDADGKPTKWESAEYQPRTHWTEETEILPETVVECSEEDADGDGVGDGVFSGMLPDISLTPNAQYDVYYNGTKYSCTALLVQDDEEAWVLVLGNTGAAMGEGDTGEPFIMVITYYPSEGYSPNMIVSLDGSTTVTLSIVEVKYMPIPRGYLANALPYYVEAVREKLNDTSLEYSTAETVENLTAVLETGRDIILRVNEETSTDGTRITWLYRLTAINQGGTGALLFYSELLGELCLEPQTDGTYSLSRLSS